MLSQYKMTYWVTLQCRISVTCTEHERCVKEIDLKSDWNLRCIPALRTRGSGAVTRARHSNYTYIAITQFRKKKFNLQNMQILVANIAKSEFNLQKLKDHINSSLGQHDPFIFCIIEPPHPKDQPNLFIFLSTFFSPSLQDTEILTSPKINDKHKIIFVHNKQIVVTEIKLADVSNHESGRCFGVQFSWNGIPYNFYAIHGLDLINFPEKDYERNVCEYNIYKQLKIKSSEETIIAGDFNANQNNYAINSKLGLNASADETKKYDYLNVTDLVINKTLEEFPNAAAENIKGSFYFHNTKYEKSKWNALDQIFYSKALQKDRIKDNYYITTLHGGHDLIKHLKTNKIKSNRFQYFDHLPIYVRL